jgi:hypothetical protein
LTTEGLPSKSVGPVDGNRSVQSLHEEGSSASYRSRQRYRPPRGGSYCFGGGVLRVPVQVGPCSGSPSMRLLLRSPKMDHNGVHFDAPEGHESRRNARDWFSLRGPSAHGQVPWGKPGPIYPLLVPPRDGPRLSPGKRSIFLVAQRSNLGPLSARWGRDCRVARGAPRK